MYWFSLIAGGLIQQINSFFCVNVCVSECSLKFVILDKIFYISRIVKSITDSALPNVSNCQASNAI